MTNSKFIFNKIETRSSIGKKGLKKYIVKGYAVAGDVPHTYMKQYDTSGKVVKDFKSLFTENFIKGFGNKLKYSKVYVDALHQIAKNINIKGYMEKIKEKTEGITDDELEGIESQLELGQLPLAKVSDFKIDENGIFVETEMNPVYREYDESHKKYFDAIWYSLENGFLNGMSIDFKPTKVTNINGIEQIDEGDVFGINYMNANSLGASAGITEVAVRGILETRQPITGEKTMENENKKEDTLPPEVIEMKAQLEAQSKLIQEMRNKEAEKEKQVTEQAIENEKAEYKKTIEDLQKQLKGKTETPTSEGKKGTVSTARLPSEGKSKEWFKDMAKDMSWKDLVALQAEFNLQYKNVPENMKALLKREGEDTVLNK